jgi:hypothetical protein
MQTSSVLTIALNPRVGARVSHLSRQSSMPRGRLVNALLADILDAIDFKSGRDLMPRLRDEEPTDA